MKQNHTTKHGKVYIVGAGPGNPQLLTLRAIDCMKEADVILHDRLIPEEILSTFAPQAKLVYVGKKASYHTLPQDEIEDRLIHEAKKGRRVVRLKGGDPFIFGRGGEECERLHAAGIDFEVVPGISSAFAVPLYAGIPLTHRNYASGITIVTGHENPKKGEIPYRSGVEREASSWVDWPALAKMGTIVFLMGVGNLRANMSKLLDNGKPGDTPVAVIRWGGIGKQKTVMGTIDSIADLVKARGLKAPAIIVVGGVVEFSKKMNWFEKQAYYGKTFLITRDAENNQKLAQKLQECSAQVISWPSFKVTESRLTPQIKRELKNISKYNWIIFTSKRAVDSFLLKYFKIYGDFRPMTKIKIAAVGKETANRLKQEKLWVDLVPKVSSIQGLIQENVFRRKKGLKIFMPHASDSSDDFIQAYAEKHKIFASVFYHKKTIIQDHQEVIALKNKVIDWVLFYSPSAVDSFLANFKDESGMKILTKSNVAVIGQTTAKHLRKKGVEPKIVSKKSSTKDLLEMIRQC